MDSIEKFHKLISHDPEMRTPARKACLISTLLESFSIQGEVVEMGCFEGMTSCLMQFLMELFSVDKTLHVYDSFTGLAGKGDQDGPMPEGSFRTRKQVVINNFSRFGLRHPVIHEGLIKETKPDEIPNTICFAMLDMDLYQPTLDALNMIWDRVSSGGIIMVDDYTHPLWPGIERCLTTFAGPRNIAVQQPRYVDATAIIRKP